MLTRFAIVSVLLVGACHDSQRTRASNVDGPSSTGRAALRGATSPTLATPTLATPTIENLDGVPAEARARVENTVVAVVENRTMDFLDTVSMGGFTIGSLALTKEQAQAELAGRTVAELNDVACTSMEACRWSVRARDANRLELLAHANGTLVGAIELVLEDDGSWGVAGARPMIAARR